MPSRTLGARSGLSISSRTNASGPDRRRRPHGVATAAALLGALAFSVAAQAAPPPQAAHTASSTASAARIDIGRPFGPLSGIALHGPRLGVGTPYGPISGGPPRLGAPRHVRSSHRAGPGAPARTRGAPAR